MFLKLSKLLNISRPQTGLVLEFDAGTLSQVPVSLPHLRYIWSVKNYLALFKIVFTEIHPALWTGPLTSTSSSQISHWWLSLSSMLLASKLSRPSSPVDHLMQKSPPSTSETTLEFDNPESSTQETPKLGPSWLVDSLAPLATIKDKTH